MFSAHGLPRADHCASGTAPPELQVPDDVGVLEHVTSGNAHSMADRACYNCGETGTPPSPSPRLFP
eukprot:COSAG04_NODE_1125_length_8150_cov_9.257484_2_plen_66_part_00